MSAANGVAEFVDVEFDITVAQTPLTCAATVATPLGGAPRTLLLLVHGGTYTRWYWHPTYEPHSYSTVLAAARHGLATVSIDLLGSGASSRPDSTMLGFVTHAAVLDQIARQARNGGIVDRAFDRIVVVGHSLGSAIAITLLDAGGSVDAAVITGFGRRRPPGAGGLTALSQAAVEDPRFGTDEYRGYNTLPAGSRPFFYHLPTTAAGMIFEDELRRDVSSLPDLADMGRRDWESTPSPTTAPVCVVIGAHDFFYQWSDEQSFAESQRQYYPNAAEVRTIVVPDAGHNVALHGDGPQATEQWLDWVERLA